MIVTKTPYRPTDHYVDAKLIARSLIDLKQRLVCYTLRFHTGRDVNFTETLIGTDASEHHVCITKLVTTTGIERKFLRHLAQPSFGNTLRKSVLPVVCASAWPVCIYSFCWLRKFFTGPFTLSNNKPTEVSGYSRTFKLSLRTQSLSTAKVLVCSPTDDIQCAVDCDLKWNLLRAMKLQESNSFGLTTCPSSSTRKKYVASKIPKQIRFECGFSSIKKVIFPLPNGIEVMAKKLHNVIVKRCVFTKEKDLRDHIKSDSTFQHSISEHKFVNCYPSFYVSGRVDILIDGGYYVECKKKVNWKNSRMCSQIQSQSLASYRENGNHYMFLVDFTSVYVVKISSVGNVETYEYMKYEPEN